MTPNAFTKLCDLVGPTRAAELLDITYPGMRYIMRKKMLKPMDKLRLERALQRAEELIEEIRQS